MSDEHGHLVARAVELLLDVICVVDRHGTFLYVSGAPERVFGYRADEMIGRRMIEFVLPEDRAMTLAAAAEIMAGKPKTLLRNRYVRKDGSIVHIMWSAQGAPDGTRVAVARDISALVRAEALQVALYAISEAAHAAEDLPALFERIRSIITALAPGSRLSIALCSSPGKSPGNHPGETPSESPCLTFPCEVTPEAVRGEVEALGLEVVHAERARLAEGERMEPPPVLERSAAEPGHLWLGIPLRARTGIIGVILLRRANDLGDVESDRELLQFVSAQTATAIERKQAGLRLRHLALHDALTALPNRTLFEDRLRLACARARRQRTHVGLLFIDLDGFKAVNDTWGHAVGDQLLCQVAERLSTCVRESDSLGRLGGDEFMAVLDGLGAPEDAHMIAERIRAALARPFEVAGHHLQLSSSIGISLYPDHGENNQTLIRVADQAMYEAKAQGKNSVCFAGVIANVAHPTSPG